MFLEPEASVQTQIMAGLTQLTNAVERWAVPLAAIGTVSMALIQAVKNATPVRNWFQRLRLRKWLMASIRGNYGGSRSVRLFRGMKESVRYFRGSERQERRERLDLLRKVEQDLISLATSGDMDAFYDLPIEGLCDQIRKIMSVVLDYPNSHELLLRCLARGVSSSDLDRVFGEYKATVLDDADQSVSDEKAAFREFAAAKGRILIQTRCSVDAIQTSIGFRWKFWLQLVSMILSAILGIVALNLGAINAGKGDLKESPELWTSLLIGLLAGFIAPVARDLVAGIEKWRS